MIKCVLFDLDGTIIDDEEFTIISKIVEGKKYGLDIKREDVIASLGMSKENSRKHFCSIYGDDFPADELRVKRKDYIIEDMKKNGITLKPYAIEILDFLDEKGIKKVICTSTLNENIIEYKKYGNIFDRFDYIITGDMVEKGKPNPEIFLKGANVAGNKINECLVIEDSNTGVEAAINGNFDVIMIPDLVKPLAKYENSIKIYKNLKEAIEYIKNML